MMRRVNYYQWRLYYPDLLSSSGKLCFWHRLVNVIVPRAFGMLISQNPISCPVEAAFFDRYCDKKLHKQAQLSGYMSRHGRIR